MYLFKYSLLILNLLFFACSNVDINGQYLNDKDSKNEVTEGTLTSLPDPDYDDQLEDTDTFNEQDIINADISCGLVSQYLFDDNLDNLVDSKLNGTGTWITFGEDRFGNSNGAIIFSEPEERDFESDPFGLKEDPSYLEMPAAINPVSYHWSWSSWIRIDNKNVPGILLGDPLSSGGWHQNFVYIRQDTQNIGSYCYGTNISSEYLPNVGEWFHLTFVVSETTVSFYVNGKLTNRETNFEFENSGYAFEDNTDLFTVSAPYIFKDDERRYFVGAMDDMRFYNRSLQDADVAKLFACENNSSRQCIIKE